MASVANRSAARPRAALVFNPKKHPDASLRLAVAAAERRHGWGKTLWVSSKPRRSKPVAQALAENVDLLIVAGGDGSVRRAIADLLGSDLPFAIVPTGTGNLLARSLGLPVGNLDAALDVAFGAHERRVDVIEIDTAAGEAGGSREVSVVLSGIGIDAAMIANTKPELKRRFGWIAYVDGVIRSLDQVAPFPVHISVDGREERTHRVAAVFIANLVDLPGNLQLVPGAALDDGLLDVVVLQPRGWFDWLFIWRRFSWENAVLRRTEFGSQIAETLKGKHRGQVVYTRGHRVHVTVDGAEQPFQVDGDTAGAVRSLTASVIPGGVRVRVPAN